MSNKDFPEKKIFNTGNLIKLREGIPTYPYFLSLEKYYDDSKMNIESFSDCQYLILSQISDVFCEEVIGYECLSSNGKVYVMDIDQYDIELEVGFCFIKV
tara:strand:+ start:46 stop:345 length:300 start_codon:yes stop_codon:yes gene_type:complete